MNIKATVLVIGLMSLPAMAMDNKRPRDEQSQSDNKRPALPRPVLPVGNAQSVVQPPAAPRRVQRHAQPVGHLVCRRLGFFKMKGSC